MTTCTVDRQEAQTASLGILEVPTITQLGSLDDDQGTSGLGLNAASPQPVFAIIYNGI